MLLDIEARIGELLPQRDEGRRLAGKRTQGLQRGEDLPGAHPGMSDRKAYESRAIKNNPAIVAKIKAQARENEDIPTPSGMPIAPPTPSWRAEAIKKAHFAQCSRNGPLSGQEETPTGP